MQGTFDSNVANTPAVKAVGTNGANGITAASDGTAIQASSDRKFGVVAGTTDGIALVGNSLGEGMGVRATSKSSWAVNAQSGSGVGILGASDTNVGIQGECQSGYNFGVVGRGANAGVVAFNPNNDHAAYLASDCCAAWFTGGVTVTGKITKGGGGFKIDHPLYPGEKFLSHSFVESPDMKNLYDGIAIADRKGRAVVTLPKWFSALNCEFRYQLTPIGNSAPDLHVSQEIKGNRFKIAGARPAMKISWQVTGIRHDSWAKANPNVVEEKKESNERGYYLHPHLHGFSSEKSIGLLRHPHSKNPAGTKKSKSRRKFPG